MARIPSFSCIMPVMRTPHDLIEGPPECPSDNEKTGAKALSLDEVERLKDDFVTAAKRAEAAGFNGAELHGAHGYIHLPIP